MRKASSIKKLVIIYKKLGKLGLSKEFHHVYLALDDNEMLKLKDKLSVCYEDQETD